jgi:hypothetical protein
MEKDNKPDTRKLDYAPPKITKVRLVAQDVVLASCKGAYTGVTSVGGFDCLVGGIPFCSFGGS